MADQHEWAQVRLVVTGHDENGTGTVVRDELIGPKAGLAADGWQAYLLWGADQMPALPDQGKSEFQAATPSKGGVRLSQLDVLPQKDQHLSGDDPVEIQGIHRPAGGGAGIHFTSTVDLLVVLDGEVTLELDDGQMVPLRKGDYAVQNGTRHAWHNFTDEPARLGVIVLGADHAGFA